MDLLAVVFQPKEQIFVSKSFRGYSVNVTDFKLKLYMWKFYFLIVVLPEISSTLRAGFKKLQYEAQFLEKILQSWVNFH